MPNQTPIKDSLRALFLKAQSQVDTPTKMQLPNGLRIEVTIQSNHWTMLMLSRPDRLPTEQELRDVLNALPYSLEGVPTVTPLMMHSRYKFYVATMWQTVVLDQEIK